LTERIVTIQRYHSNEPATWEGSEIREWLNGSFIENTFTTEERRHIAESRVTNDNNPAHGTSGGISTIDHIFLLSIDEAQTYFTDNEARIARDAAGTASWWWLRSPGYNSLLAACVNSDGNVIVYGIYVDLEDGGVRPALWLNL
jgi:hypothetical protein